MTTEPTFSLHQGSEPLLVSMPHIGTEIPEDLRGNYQQRALGVEDTDWHLAQLYDFLPGLGASVLMPRFSRYVIDLNRPPDDAPMYPGASNTELCPTRFFTGDPLYLEGREPDATERQRRRERFWQPYHAALQAELERLWQKHGFVLLWDAHSIRSRIPWLFEGRLPDLNFGSASDSSADPRITQAAAAACAELSGISHVVNGRFKGGYITRHYGDPARQLHALQLEKCQSLYMMEVAPFSYLPLLADKLKPALRGMVLAALNACKAIYAH